MPEKNYLYVAEIIKPKGLNGLVVVRLLTDFPQNLKPEKTLYLFPPVSDHASLTIKDIKIKGEYAEILFKEIDGIDKSEELRGRLLGIKFSEAESLADNTYWEHQIIGLKVITSTGRKIGSVSEILKTGGNDVYLVKGPGGKESLIPAIKDIIIKIDLSKGHMIIEPMDGLLEEE